MCGRYVLQDEEGSTGPSTAASAPDMNPSADAEPRNWPITGTLDLHLFQPTEVGDLVPTYLNECRKRGILQVRIIHGKGTGPLRESVHAVLRRIPGVAAFSLVPETLGRWGATVVALKPIESARENSKPKEKG